MADRDIADWFGLSYSNFLVLHRVELEHMPPEWQHRFVAMVEELNDAFEHLEHPEGYNVYPCKWVESMDLDEADMQATGVTVVHTEDSMTYYNSDGDELDPQQRLPVPVRDPIPHYRRGHVEPRLTGGER